MNNACNMQGKGRKKNTFTLVLRTKQKLNPEAKTKHMQFQNKMLHKMPLCCPMCPSQSCAQLRWNKTSAAFIASTGWCRPKWPCWKISGYQRTGLRDTALSSYKGWNRTGLDSRNKHLKWNVFTWTYLLPFWTLQHGRLFEDLQELSARTAVLNRTDQSQSHQHMDLVLV